VKKKLALAKSEKKSGEEQWRSSVLGVLISLKKGEKKEHEALAAPRERITVCRKRSSSL